MPAPHGPRRPAFKITLEGRKSPHLLERQPRYAVLVNGAQQGELYYNMRGYQGYLPTVHGSRLDIGERGISAFRREVTLLNREAEQAIERGAADARRIVLTRPTTDGGVVFALSRDALTGTDATHLISRRELIQARRLFGSDDLGAGFFRPLDLDTEPVVLFEPGDEALAAGLPQLRSRIMDPVEAEAHEREIERVIRTADPEVLLVVSRRTRDGADPEPHYVTRWGHETALARFGPDLRLSDLIEVGTRPAIPDPGDRAFLRGQFTWFGTEDEQPWRPDLSLLSSGAPDADLEGPA
ncbi:MAG: hypothetical protein KC466_01735 [Myxococcales bacterium]|nr:hypothetical protein [Myxococcales bacterium]